jgi:hypothetical protein
MKPGGSARTGRTPRVTVRAVAQERAGRRPVGARKERTAHATRVRGRGERVARTLSASRRDFARIVEKTAADRIAVLAVEKPKSGGR